MILDVGDLVEINSFCKKVEKRILGIVTHTIDPGVSIIPYEMPKSATLYDHSSSSIGTKNYIILTARNGHYRIYHALLKSFDLKLISSFKTL